LNEESYIKISVVIRTDILISLTVIKSKLYWQYKKNTRLVWNASREGTELLP